MNCPSADKLSQYVDDLLIEQEKEAVKKHVNHCTECQRIIMALKDEQHYFQEVLQSPALPDDFTANILDQLEPYEQKAVPPKRKPWKRVMYAAATVVVALGVSAAVTPSFASWISGLFTTDQVDEGVRLAADAGLLERVNLTVTDQNITFKVEDVVADPSRVVLSFQILNQNGKPLKADINNFAMANGGIKAVDQNGQLFEMVGTGWREASDYGYIEVPLREHAATEKLTVHIDLKELNGVKGNWQLDVPVDLTKSNALTTKTTFDEIASRQGVSIHLNEMKFAPSSTEFIYETLFTNEEQAKIERHIQALEAKFGKESVTSGRYGTAIHFHFENADGQTIYEQDDHNFYTEDSKPGDMTQYQNTGFDTEQLGHVKWNQSFFPHQDDRALTFVWDGVLKTVPSDFSIAIDSKNVKKDPVTFDYEGNFLTINKVKKKHEFYLQKSIWPVGKRTSIVIEMEGGTEPLSSTLGTWVVVDDKGHVYPAYESGSILNEKDKNGRHQMTIDLVVYDLEEIPEQLTLHLISVTRYEKVEEPWRVPLYEE
ncbi:DUF4179 domain-containing protein [Sporosarcina sp. HYO08]|uniref:DUF4179 domain-containing protein n=1 Tax=Sporosarcina sp. HYO08 TaxID=1759557 RepID=UPI000797E506|nr:DUF4179 domain-containing protein [Sporosarcina sp. HYO08]KXH81697.1 hypothetical protein AU377_05370 [Sporosarcina sp. HYO08]